MAINVGYRHRPTDIEYAGIGANDSPAVGTNSEGTNRVINVNFDWFARSRTTITAKYVRMDEQSEAVAVTDLGFQPPFDPTNLAAMGRVVVGGVAVGGASLGLNRQNYYRDEVKANLAHLFDLGRIQHEVTTGFGWDQGVEDLTAPEQRLGRAEHRHRQRPATGSAELLPRAADAALEGPFVLAVTCRTTSRSTRD